MRFYIIRDEGAFGQNLPSALAQESENIFDKFLAGAVSRRGQWHLDVEKRNDATRLPIGKEGASSVLESMSLGIVADLVGHRVSPHPGFGVHRSAARWEAQHTSSPPAVGWSFFREQRGTPSGAVSLC
jgi:hypothetical protein